MKKIPLLIAIVSMLVSVSTLAGDPEAGKAKSAVCAGCHGVDGVSPSPAFPNIAGQYADYLEHVLKEYRSGVRPNPVMAGMSASLSDDDIADLAAYFSQQSGLKLLPSDPM